MQDSNKIKIAIVEDHHVVREALYKLLDATDNYDLIIEASNGREFLDKIKHVDIDVVLLDLEMPVMNGLQTVRELKKLNSNIKIIMLTMHDDKDIVFDMLTEGVDAYLLKECSTEDMVLAIQKVHKNKKRYYTKIMNDAIIHNVAEGRKTKISADRLKLTDREMLVLKMICDGRTSVYISNSLATSKKNVDLVRTKLMRKLDVHSANELIRIAILNKLYVPRTNSEIEIELIKDQNAALERRLHNLKQNSIRNMEED